MRILGWLLVVGLVPMMFIYPPGFMWGAAPEGFPVIGPAHPPSPYDGLHPYLYMLVALYVAYGILLIQSFFYPNEHAHMWSDVPFIFLMAGVLWIWHPARKGRA
jgi:hypothetical protein